MDEFTKEVDSLTKSAKCEVCGVELGPIGVDANHHIEPSWTGPLGYHHFCRAHCPECNQEQQ